MIRGLTHDIETGVINRIVKYRGKISAGFAPKEPPNTNNYPIAAGYFRMLKEVNETLIIDGKEIVRKTWKINKEVQDKLCESTGSQTPRKIDFICLYATPDQLWESCLVMFAAEGMKCRSHGKDTQAKFLIKENGVRKWIDREFNGKKGCAFQDCPDYKEGRCKQLGLMNVFPTIDLVPQPYRFETRSINTINGIESSIDSLWNLVKAAHNAVLYEAGKKLQFQGLYGAKLSLKHRKIKSGGRDVYITDIVPSDAFSQSLMSPIIRGIELNQKLQMSIGGDAIPLIGNQLNVETNNDNILLPSNTISDSLDTDDAGSIEDQYPSAPNGMIEEPINEHVESTDSLMDEAAKAMLNTEGSK